MKTILSLCLLFVAFALPLQAASTWGTNYQTAMAQAKSEHKLLLMNFTGSDWCPYCIKLENEVLSTSTFTDFAKDKYVLLTVDFPQTKEQPDAEKAQNEELNNRFDVEGFPTVIVVDPSTSQELGRTHGYQPGSGPDAFIDELKSFVKS